MRWATSAPVGWAGGPGEDFEKVLGCFVLVVVAALLTYCGAR